MLNLIITIRGSVDDDNEAQRILQYIEDCTDGHPEDNLTSTCKCTQEITNG